MEEHALKQHPLSDILALVYARETFMPGLGNGAHSYKYQCSKEPKYWKQPQIKQESIKICIGICLIHLVRIQHFENARPEAIDEN